MVEYDVALTELENRVFDMLRELKPTTNVVWKGSQLPKSTEQFILLDVGTNIIEVGIGEDIGYDDNVEFPIAAKQWEVYVDVECRRGRNTQQYLMEIIHAFQKQHALYWKYFPDSNYGFLRVLINPVRVRVPIDKEVLEERSRMSIVFSMTTVTTSPVGDENIESVEIDPLIIRLDEDQIIITDTFTINPDLT